jgi:8-oxo-dGTP diphosphatase
MSNYLHEIPVTAVIENNGQFLFTKRSIFEAKMPGIWTFPGGKVEAGEDIIQALFREMQEETDLEFTNEVAFLSTYQFITKDSSQGIVFLLRSKNRDIKQDKSIEEYRWINPEDIMDYKFSFKPIADFKTEKMTTIPGMEVHVRNAMIILKKNLLLDKTLFTVTEYQKDKCTMNKEYFLNIKNSESVEDFLETNSLLPHCV